MSKWLADIKNARTVMTLVPIVYYMLLLVTILTGDPEHPRTLHIYNELAFVPLVVMVTAVFCQNEFGGSAMEIIATYPVSFAAMLLRKTALAACTATILHFGCISAYQIHFHTLSTAWYPYGGGKAVETEMTWLKLWLQALPEYAAAGCFTLLGIIGGKRLYGGFAAGFGLWMLDALSGGAVLKQYGLFTSGLPHDASFPANRAFLTAGALMSLAIAAWLLNRRERWLLHEEPE